MTFRLAAEVPREFRKVVVSGQRLAPTVGALVALGHLRPLHVFMPSPGMHPCEFIWKKRASLGRCWSLYCPSDGEHSAQALPVYFFSPSPRLVSAVPPVNRRASRVNRWYF